MRPHLARLVMTHHDDIQILFVIGEIGACGFGSGRAVARKKLPEIGNHELRLARAVLQKVIELRRAMHSRYLRESNDRAARWPRCVALRRETRCSSARSQHPKEKNPDPWTHSCAFV